MEFSDPTPIKVLPATSVPFEDGKAQRKQLPSLPDPWRACTLWKLIMNSGCSSQEDFPFLKTCDSAPFLSLHFVGQTWNSTNLTPKIKKTRNNISGIQEHPASNTSPSLPWLIKQIQGTQGCPELCPAWLGHLQGWGSLCQASPPSQGRIFG